MLDVFFTMVCFDHALQIVGVFGWPYFRFYCWSKSLTRLFSFEQTSINWASLNRNRLQVYQPTKPYECCSTSGSTTHNKLLEKTCFYPQISHPQAQIVIAFEPLALRLRSRGKCTLNNLFTSQKARRLRSKLKENRKLEFFPNWVCCFFFRPIDLYKRRLRVKLFIYVLAQVIFLDDIKNLRNSKLKSRKLSEKNSQKHSSKVGNIKWP